VLEFTKAKIMSKLLFCLLVAVASAQQWEDYETDSADYNSDYNSDYRSADYSESSDLDSGLWREEAVLLTPQDRERESTRVERDGGFHGHGGGHSSSRRRSGRRQQESGGRRQRPQEEFQGERQAPAPVAQEERRGRQSGGVGLALGMLNNPADADGNYNFNFADDGMEREESGHPGAVEGGYSYTSPEGELVSVEYVADEFGFHPVGSHIPVAPPMPPHVRRLLDHLAKVNGLAKLY
jgi:hypothetical protein